MPEIPATAASARWSLTRYFSLTSLLGVVAVTAALIGAYRQLAEANLVEHESRTNADITRVFANSVWARHSDFVARSAGLSRERLLADPALPELRREVLQKMRGSRVAKVKVYNLQGLTIFSTDERQIGEDKSGNAGFQAARRGETADQLLHRDRFDAFEGVINNRDLIASYIPLHAADGGPVEAVFEVYSDVTSLLAEVRRAQWQIALVVLAVLALLYLFLLYVVRKADRLIARQDAERTAQQAQIRHQAYHDALTGLPNRSYFGERLREAMGLASRHGHSGALLYLDLDRFKIINDSLGHEAGDIVLRTAGERIREALRESDLLFRMGGDEFTVILPRIAAPEDAVHVAQRIAGAVARPVSVYGHELNVGVTMGIAAFPADGQTPEALLKNADAAMYTAKQAGRGGHAFYQAEMNARAMQRLQLQGALQRAFSEGEFVLHYQPRVDPRTQRVIAAEALLRWASPSRGLVPPGEFIGVLEELNMMPMVGEWVLRTACHQWLEWRRAGLTLRRVSVNVSARQLDDGRFVQSVARVLHDTGIDPAALELELTESMLLAGADRGRATVQALRQLGVRLAIDDFGTGYSSLGYLRDLDVDFLKIDRSFVSGVATDSRDRALAIAIAELAKALGMTVVAEGVETVAQAEFFKGIECGELQGFLFSKAVPAEALAALWGGAGPGHRAMHDAPITAVAAEAGASA